MVSLSSVSSLQTAIALAERQVQRDASQVQQDTSQLAQSQAQLDSDQAKLSSAQQQERQQAQQRSTPPAPSLERAIQAKVKPPAQAPVTAATASLPTPPAAILETPAPKPAAAAAPAAAATAAVAPAAAPIVTVVTPFVESGAKAQVNTIGQTIGTLINVTA